MFSRKSHTLSTFAILGLIVSCGETSLGPQAPAMGGGECIKESSQTLSDYLDGNADLPAIDSVFDCMDSMVKTFKERTLGETQGGYSSKELKEFAKKYFFRESSLDPELWDELIYAKTIVLGGSPDRLTHAELERLRSLLVAAREMSRSTRQWFPVSHLAKKSEQQFNQGLKSLFEFGRMLFLDPSRSYSISRLKKLILLMTHESETGTKFAEWINLGLASYELSFQPVSEPAIGKNNIRDIEELAKDVYKVNKSFVKFMEPSLSMFSGRGLDELNAAGVATLKILNRTIERRYYFWLARTKDRTQAIRNAVITMPELANWLDRVSIKGSFMGISTTALKTILEPLFIKTLGASKHRGITYAWIEDMKTLLSTWYSTQKALSLVFEIASSKGEFNKTKTYRFELLKALYSQEFKDTFPRNEVKWDIEDLILQSQPLLGFEGRVLSLDPDKGLDGGLSLFNVSVYHLLKLVTKNIILGYSQKQPPLDSTNPTLTRETLAQVISDITPLGLELLILDPEGFEVHKKRFLESNLFLPSSTGDHFVDARELTELVIYLSSAGALGARIQEDMAQACPKETTYAEKKYGYPRIKADCFKKEFIPRFADYFSYLPHMHRLIESMSGAEKENFLDSALKAGSLYVLKRGEMSEDDSQGLVALLQYVETIFLRYDTNSSGTIDYNESAIAFHQFKTELRIINDKAAKLPDDKLFSFFTYILAFGKTTPIINIIVWSKKSEEFKSRKVNADRTDILKVFESMMSAAKAHSSAVSPGAKP